MINMYTKIICGSKHEYTMEPTKFLKKNRNLFKNYCFSFEGLESDIVKQYTRAVEDLGAKVTRDSLYTFINPAHITECKKRNLKNIYDISYIYLSIRGQNPLDISLFRLDEQNILNECDVLRVIDNVSNKLIPKEKYKEKHMYLTNLQNSDLQLIKYNKNSENICNITEKQGCKKSVSEWSNQKYFIKEVKVDSDIHSNSLIPIKNATGSNKCIKEVKNISEWIESRNIQKVIKQIVKKEISENLDDSDCDIFDEMIVKSDNIPRNSLNKYSNKCESVLNLIISKNIPEKMRVEHQNINCVSESLNSNKYIEKVQNTSKWIDNKNIHKNIDQPVQKKRKLKLHNDSEIFSVQLIDDKEKTNDCSNWWLIQSIPENNKCKIPSCVYEPTSHSIHKNPRRMMSLTEKRILLKYLICTHAISKAKGVNIYHRMHVDRYLLHRTVETLRNCIRRTILPKIEEYGLPQEILSQFLILKSNS